MLMELQFFTTDSIGISNCITSPMPLQGNIIQVLLNLSVLEYLNIKKDFSHMILKYFMIEIVTR